MTFKGTRRFFKRLTKEIGETGFVKQLFEAAKSGDPQKVQEAFDTFKEKSPELYKEIKRKVGTMNFELVEYEGERTKDYPEEVGRWWTYQNEKEFEKVDPHAFVALLFLAERYEVDLIFENIDIICNALRKAGDPALADYIRYNIYLDSPCYEWLTKLYAK